MTIGFHIEGVIITALVLLPNLLFLILPPNSIPEESKSSLKLNILEIFERVGQIGCFLLPVIFGLKENGILGILLLIMMGAMLLIYYAGWLRYLVKGREYQNLFSRMLGIPIPMAVCPVLYFVLAALGMRSFIMAIAVLFLAVGHIYISYKSYTNFTKHESELGEKL